MRLRFVRKASFQEVIKENKIAHWTLLMGGGVFILQQEVIATRKGQQRPNWIFATVCPKASHFYQLRELD